MGGEEEETVKVVRQADIWRVKLRSGKETGTDDD